MALKIDDLRIGFKDRSGTVRQRPGQFATGGYWNASQVPDPTTVFFGPGKNFFYVLPINVVSISDELKQELATVIEPVAKKMYPEYYSTDVNESESENNE